MKPMVALHALVLVILVGCVQQPLAINSTSQSTQVPTMPVEDLQFPTPESTFVPIDPDYDIRSFCPEASLDRSDISDLIGTIVLSGDNIRLIGRDLNSASDRQSVLLFWDISSGIEKEHELPKGQEYYYYVTSPDKEKIAFTEGKTTSTSSEVVVLNKLASEIGRISLPDDWTLFDWIDNEQLMVRQLRLLGKNTDLVVINLLNQKQQFLSSTFPGIYSGQPLISWGASTIYDPTMSLVLYPGLNEKEITSVLWDVQDNQEVIKVLGGKWPRWSSDGKQLLIVLDYEAKLHEFHDELYLISSDGDVMRLTNLKEQSLTSIINLPVWSPDGRYVAFWLSDDIPVETAKIAILDTETFIVQLYCREFNPFPFRFGDSSTLGYSDLQVNATVPVWSPDSNYLLVEDYSQFLSSTYLFDLEKHMIFQLAENARPVSWMK